MPNNPFSAFGRGLLLITPPLPDTDCPITHVNEINELTDVFISMSNGIVISWKVDVDAAISNVPVHTVNVDIFAQVDSRASSPRRHIRVV